MEWQQGEWADAGIDMYDYPLRMYDPVLGRFHAPDPFEQGYSPYVALADNPANYVDPTGGSWACILEYISQHKLGTFNLAVTAINGLIKLKNLKGDLKASSQRYCQEAMRAEGAGAMLSIAQPMVPGGPSNVRPKPTGRKNFNIGNNKTPGGVLKLKNIPPNLKKNPYAPAFNPPLTAADFADHIEFRSTSLKWDTHPDNASSERQLVKGPHEKIVSVLLDGASYKLHLEATRNYWDYVQYTYSQWDDKTPNGSFIFKSELKSISILGRDWEKLAKLQLDWEEMFTTKYQQMTNELIKEKVRQTRLENGEELCVPCQEREITEEERLSAISKIPSFIFENIEKDIIQAIGNSPLDQVINQMGLETEE